MPVKNLIFEGHFDSMDDNRSEVHSINESVFNRNDPLDSEFKKTCGLVVIVCSA